MASWATWTTSPSVSPRRTAYALECGAQGQAFRELNVQVKKIAMGDHLVLVLGDDMNVYSMGENTVYVATCATHR